jgi:hypothetical protein
LVEVDLRTVAEVAEGTVDAALVGEGCAWSRSSAVMPAEDAMTSTMRSSHHLSKDRELGPDCSC